MKRLKPGQLCTIYGVQWNAQKKNWENHIKHVYRCKKATAFTVCTECIKANKDKGCVLQYYSIYHSARICVKFFGPQNYPVLVK